MKLNFFDSFFLSLYNLKLIKNIFENFHLKIFIFKKYIFDFIKLKELKTKIF